MLCASCGINDLEADDLSMLPHLRVLLALPCLVIIGIVYDKISVSYLAAAVSFSFNGSQRLSIHLWEERRWEIMDVSFRFRTHRPTGFLLVTASHLTDDHLEVALVDGKVRVNISLTSEAKVTNFYGDITRLSTFGNDRSVHYRFLVGGIVIAVVMWASAAAVVVVRGIPCLPIFLIAGRNLP